MPSDESSQINFDDIINTFDYSKNSATSSDTLEISQKTPITPKTLITPTTPITPKTLTTPTTPTTPITPITTKSHDVLKTQKAFTTPKTSQTPKTQKIKTSDSDKALNKAILMKEKLMAKYLQMSSYEIKEWYNNNLLVAGIDEVGRGPLAGPVVVAACILDPNDPILGLDDSKKLSEKLREELYEQIVNRAVCYSIVRLEPEEIDEINILNATKKAMVMCVEILPQKPDKLLVDAIDLKGTEIPVVPIIKGDTLSVSIAAASILAKVVRDKIMTEYDLKYPGYGFAKHKGYGTTLHYEGIKKHGITPIHRKTFLKGWI